MASRAALAAAWGTLATATLASSPALAGTITGVSGELARGQSITVTGSGFGSVGPTVALFDDFDDCPACQAGAAVTVDGADVGAWNQATNFPTYTDEDSHAGLSMLASNYLPTSGGCPGPGGTGCESSSNYSRMTYGFSPPATEVFWSFWRFLPAGQTFPLESCNNINWKVSWLYGNAADPTNVINDWMAPVYNAQNHAEGFEEPSIGSNQGLAETNCGKDMYPMYMIEPAATGNWIRYSIHVRGSTDCDGTFRLWQIPFVTTDTGGAACGSGNNTCVMLRKERTAIDTMVEPWHSLTFNGYARNAEDGCQATDVSVPRYDDAYVAVGPGAQARVEIASHATWGDPAVAAELDMSICPPTAWSDTAVSCTLAPGSFQAAQQAYVFVVDANGEVSDQDPALDGAQGFPITLGADIGSGGAGPGAGSGGAASGAGPGSGAGAGAGAGASGGAASGSGNDASDAGGDSACSCRQAAPARGELAWLLAVGLAAASGLRRRRAPSR
jgi:hypothetical protein